MGSAWKRAMKNSRRQSRRGWLALPLAALGLALASGATLALQCHVGTITFYPEGGLKSCEIEANHEFRTVIGTSLACRGGALLVQHPDGSIQSCTLAAPYAARTRRCDAGTRIILNPGGEILKCE
jgi:hypothetical protein